MRDKQFILSEIRRTAAQNGGRPLGQDRFRTETGIAIHESVGVHWVRWSDALMEAGFGPLEFGAASNDEETFELLANLVRRYGRFPTNVEITFEKRNNEKIPAPNTLKRKFRSKSEILKKVQEFCAKRVDYSDVVSVLAKEKISESPKREDRRVAFGAGKLNASGYVYLVKSGKLYKIGCSENHWRRKSELHKQTSEGITEVHTISAVDDPPGIERYWHERFKDKRQHGEWFDLSPEDVSAFKKRKFM